MGLVKDGFTVVLIPSKASSVVRLRVSRVAFAVGALVLAAVLVGGGWGIYRALRMSHELAAFRALKADYLQQQVSLQRLSQRVDQFRNQIGRMRELDYKLRVITDLEVERPRPSGFGMGGSVEPRQDQELLNGKLDQADLATLLDKDLARLEEIATYQEESFNNLKAFLTDQQDLIARSPHRWPVRGFVSSHFGPRIDPFTGLKRPHEGIDIVARRGAVIQAPADGMVTFASVDPILGNMLVIDHGYGVITRYGHTDEVQVREGQRVKRGQAIATVGSTGKSTGPHLHYEIRIHDIAVNPQRYIID